MTGYGVGPDWQSDLFGREEIEALWSSEHQLVHILAFETSYARALASVGRVSAKDAETAVAHIAAFRPDEAALRQDTARDGLVVPGLIRQLKHGSEVPDAIHAGATSQDVLDTALVLTLSEIETILFRDIRLLIDDIHALSERFGSNTIMGRTRMQAAYPVLVAHRLAGWSAPFHGHLERLDQMRPRLLRVQLGGATGDRSPWGSDAQAMADAMADALGLHTAPAAWHTDRTAIAEFCGWLSLVAASCGKIGTDVALMAQQGIDEIAISGGGSSSAMPHKSNPILAELLITLARHTAALNTALQGALVHEQERSGAAWVGEFLSLPQMTVTAGRALQATHALLASIARIGAGAEQE